MPDLLCVMQGAIKHFRSEKKNCNINILSHA